MLGFSILKNLITSETMLCRYQSMYQNPQRPTVIGYESITHITKTEISSGSQALSDATSGEKVSTSSRKDEE